MEQQDIKLHPGTVQYLFALFMFDCRTPLSRACFLTQALPLEFLVNFLKPYALLFAQHNSVWTLRPVALQLANALNCRTLQDTISHCHVERELVVWCATPPINGFITSVQLSSDLPLHEPDFISFSEGNGLCNKDAFIRHLRYVTAF